MQWQIHHLKFLRFILDAVTSINIKKVYFILQSASIRLLFAWNQSSIPKLLRVQFIPLVGRLHMFDTHFLYYPEVNIVVFLYSFVHPFFIVSSKWWCIVGFDSLIKIKFISLESRFFLLASKWTYIYFTAEYLVWEYISSWIKESAWLSY